MIRLTNQLIVLTGSFRGGVHLLKFCNICSGRERHRGSTAHDDHLDITVRFNHLCELWNRFPYLTAQGVALFRAIEHDVGDFALFIKINRI